MTFLSTCSCMNTGFPMLKKHLLITVTLNSVSFNGALSFCFFNYKEIHSFVAKRQFCEDLTNRKET